MLAGTFQTKAGVSLVGAGPEVLAALSLASPIFEARGVPLVVTSVTEGRHIPGSLHPVGRAVDVRTRDLPSGEAARLARELGGVLGSAYQVILEGDHIHIEFDPRGLPGQLTPWTWASGGWPSSPGTAGGDPGGLKEALPVVAIAGALALALA